MEVMFEYPEVVDRKALKDNGGGCQHLCKQGGNTPEDQ